MIDLSSLVGGAIVGWLVWAGDRGHPLFAPWLVRIALGLAAIHLLTAGVKP